MDHAKKIVSYIFAMACMFYAFSGIDYVISYAISMSHRLYDPETPLFHITYPIMAGINFVFFVSLFIIGILYAKYKIKYWYLFLLLMFSQFAYDIIIRILWSYPDQALSISVAAATGVAGGGTVIQDQTYFWLWGSIICLLLRFVPLTRPRTPPAAQAGRA